MVSSELCCKIYNDFQEVFNDVCSELWESKLSRISEVQQEDESALWPITS